jgi:hypothetical protein
VQKDAVNPGWPPQIVKQGATLVYYQPQVVDWQGFKTSTTGLPAAGVSENAIRVSPGLGEM